MSRRMVRTALPRGVRNNNPGNIEDGIPWDGLDPDTDTDDRFCKFLSPEFGVRAMVKIFCTYKKKYKIRTVRGIISRWAPPVENDTEAYIKNVCAWTGFEEDQELEYTVDTMAALACAMARMENGTPYWPMKVYRAGAEMALV